MLKPGLYWVEYILSIRGLFLPTVSRNLADGTCLTVEDVALCVWGGIRGSSPAGVFYLNTCLF